jgi:beta-alanine degradation protein BauB
MEAQITMPTSQRREANMSAAQATTILDDERVRVTTWTFGADGDATGWHVHEYDYIVVPVTGGTFAVTAPDGDTHELTQDAGSPYLGSAGTEHDVANASGASASFVEIELKR